MSVIQRPRGPATPNRSPRAYSSVRALGSKSRCDALMARAVDLKQQSTLATPAQGRTCAIASAVEVPHTVPAGVTIAVPPPGVIPPLAVATQTENPPSPTNTWRSLENRGGREMAGLRERMLARVSARNALGKSLQRIVAARVWCVDLWDESQFWVVSRGASQCLWT